MNKSHPDYRERMAKRRANYHAREVGRFTHSSRARRLDKGWAKDLCRVLRCQGLGLNKKQRNAKKRKGY